MIETARFLLSGAGRALLAEADTLREQRAETLAALMRLRRTASPDQAAGAWEMSDLRRRGAAKFGPLAGRMYFLREALEQASGARAAAYHAERFVQASVTRVADLCGGIGGDALAFAARGLRVTAYEQDPVRVLYACENVIVHGLQDRVEIVEADVMTASPDAGAVWFDPARRQDKRRIADPDAYEPPLSLLHRLAAQGIVNIGVKLSPAIDHTLADEYGAELEFVSDGGECKEALLWRGALKSGDALRATKLTGEGPISLIGRPDESPMAQGAAGGTSLYEPDPAVIRAHLIQTLAHQLHAAPVHPQIAYLVGDEQIPTPWATVYQVLARFPYSRRRLQEAMTAHRVGHVVIKKRGFPQEPDEVRKGLKLTGTGEMTVVLTRQGEGHQVILCRPLSRT